MSARKKILLTRPRASSEHWAALLAAHGFDSVIDPLLTITPTHAPRPLGQFQAVVLTSVNALDALRKEKGILADLLSLPCFCVGASTSEAAWQWGFTTINTGTSDSAALAQMIVGALTDTSRPLLHISGDVVDGKAQDILSARGFTLVRWVVYHADAALDFLPATRDLLASGAIAAVPVFSPRSAKILLALIEKNNLTDACRSMIAIGLSQAVADVLQILPWRRLAIAATPLDQDVIDSLKMEIAMTQPETLSPPPSCLKKKLVFIGVILIILALAGGGAVALAHCPWLFPPQLVPVAADTSALERRIRNLETRLDNQPAPPPAPAAEESDAIKILTTQVEQLENQDKDNQQFMRKIIATILALSDLRAAAADGHSFTVSLASLHAVMKDDAKITAAIAALEPFASNVPPTVAQLRADLAAQASDASAASSSVWDRIKAFVQPLISVHAIHDPVLSGVDSALESGDAVAALNAFNALPDATRQPLGAWQAKLAARVKLDEAVRALTTALATPDNEQGDKP